MSEFKYESTELIHSWFTSEFKEFGVGRGVDTYCKAFSDHKEKPVDIITCSRGAVSLILYVRELQISIWVSTPRSRSKIKEVNLIDPSSIEAIQTIVRHIVSVTLSPWYNLNDVR